MEHDKVLLFAFLVKSNPCQVASHLAFSVMSFSKILGDAAGTVGVPAVAWHLLRTFGTAGTGASISGLSGAAATSATLAALGGPVGLAGWAVFGLGMVKIVTAAVKK